MKNKIFILVLSLLSTQAYAQFHNLTMPQASNHVSETQRIGVTDITIQYSSPRVNGREIWTNTSIIPQNGDPIPWRAGANMNTTIEFSTDVKIEGKDLAAGKYGFHIIPKEDTYTLLFAHHNNQWGSYYLDIEKDVTLQINVQDTVCPFSEKLDYEFIPKSSDTIIIGLEWAEKRIPFEVTVDLNKTVVASLRNELRGQETYRWQAWNDAANWCLNHDTNLEEALEWANRSINGGYGGFAAEKNLQNLTTKARLLERLGKTEEYATTVQEAFETPFTPMEANTFTIMLIRQEKYEKAIEFSEKAMEKHPDTWFLILNNMLGKYLNGDKKEAVKQSESILPMVPEAYEARVKQIIKEMEEGTFKLPQRN